jgi:hydrogenase-1 operon protein HyaE
MTLEIDTPVAAPETTPAAAAVHPLVARMMSLLDAPSLEADNFAAWTGAPGHALLVFTEDPVRYRETPDLAVIVPEIARAFAGRFRTGVLLPAAARVQSVQYGFKRWPALVLLRDGQYVGAIDGLRNWDEYLREIAQLLAAEPTRPPSIGIAVAAAGASNSSSPSCH